MNSKEILETLSSQKFADWYTSGRFEQYLSDGAISEKEILNDISGLFSNKRKKKFLNWSYPNSENSAKSGFKSTGCYSISIGYNQRTAEAKIGFDSIAEAVEFGNTLSLNWDDHITAVALGRINPEDPSKFCRTLS